ncbi:MAG: AAA family ATPase [Chloroflexaceae bacterium]|nr:AAA family ATPase [Chloroflexaceae bacterium]
MDAALETFASYVPALVLARLANHPAPLTAPVGERVIAAVLSADISGFTALTEQLVRRGPGGVEELSILLNAYFGELVDLVMSHGGDIIEFTGDGILALWATALPSPVPPSPSPPATSAALPSPAPTPEDLATVVYRAAQCGLAAQHILNGHAFTNGTRLYLRLGIGAGPVLLATVGGVLGRWELLMAGTPLVQVSAALWQARPGEVVLSPEAWSLVQHRCIGYPVGYREAATEVSTGMARSMMELGGAMRLEHLRTYLPPRPLPHIPSVPSMLQTLRDYLPGALLARLDAGQAGWVAELRRLTVLFLNVIGLEYDAPDILDRLQDGIGRLQQALYRYEGSLNQFVMDDKGTLLIAAMGLPPFNHEDDAVRGVRLALDMQESLDQMGLQSAIGVTTGLLFCGSRGNHRRRDYAMIGSVMNLAAHLMQAADGNILCDEATHQAAHTSLTFEPLPPLRIKGHDQPVAVYRPHRQPPADVCLLTNLVGRTAERDLLKARVRALADDGAGSVIVIEGEAGMGKSRLVNALLQYAHERTTACLVGKCSAVEQSTPYHVWRSVFWQVFHLGDRDSAPSSPMAGRMRVLELLRDAPDLIRLTPLLNSVLPLDIPHNDLTAQMTGQVLADNTRMLLLRILHIATSRTPTLIVLEDANWMDSASWALTMAVSQHLRSLLLVVTTRPLTDPMSGVALLRGSLEFGVSRVRLPPEGPGDAPPPAPGLPPASTAEYGYLLKRPDAYRLLLEGLPAEDVTALVSQCLGVRTLPEPVGSLIMRKAQGNPFFSQELAYALRDSGWLRLERGTCRVAPGLDDISTLDFPDTIQGVILSRIDRLTQSQQLVLKVASVIGPVFPFQMLYDIYPIEADKPALAQSLRIFEQLDLVRRETTAPDLEYAFRHVMTQEVIYHTLLFAQRRELHRAVAEWYERTAADDLSPLYERLAYHWSRARVPAKVVGYAEKAGTRALNNFANREAVRFLRQALDLTPPPHRRDSRVQRSHLERQLGEACIGLGQLPESRTHLEKAAILLGEAIPTNSLLLTTRMMREVLRQALHRLIPTRTFAPSSEAGMVMREAAHTYGLLMRIYFFANETLAALYASLRCLNLAERAWPSRWLAYAYANMGITMGSIRLHWLAEAYGRWSLDIAWQVGEVAPLVYALNLNALYRVGMGQWRKAQGALTCAVALSERLGDWASWGTCWTLMAQIAYYQGDFSRSFSMFAHLQTVARRKEDVLQQAWAMGGQGQNALRLGNLDEACAFLEEAIAWLASNAEIPSQVSNYGLLAVARLRRGDQHQARSAAEMADDLIASTPIPTAYYLIEGYAGVAEVFLALWEASQERLSLPSPPADRPDRPDCPGSLARRARQACTNLHTFARVFPIGKPRAWLCQGMYEWLAGRPAKARAAWHTSLAFATRLGMPYEQARAHEALGQHCSGDTRHAHLEEAHALFVRLGAAFDAERPHLTPRAQPAPPGGENRPR